MNAQHIVLSLLEDDGAKDELLRYAEKVSRHQLEVAFREASLHPSSSFGGYGVFTITGLGFAATGTQVERDIRAILRRFSLPIEYLKVIVDDHFGRVYRSEEKWWRFTVDIPRDFIS